MYNICNILLIASPHDIRGFFMDSIQQLDQQCPTSSRTGVTVYTWGSYDGAIKNQYLPEVTHHINSVFLQNHNPGHASLLLTLADTPENREMVSTLLEGTGIHYKAKTYQTPKIGYPENSHTISDGAFDDASMYSESVIEIYFSYWPGDKNQGVFKDYQGDLVGERPGVPVQYNMQRLQQLNPQLTPEKRPHRGRSLSTLFRQTESEMTIGFSGFCHEIQGKQELNTLIKIYQQYQMVATKLEFIKKTEKKMQARFNHIFSDPLKLDQKEHFPGNLRKELRAIIEHNVSAEIDSILNLESISNSEFNKVNDLLIKVKDQEKQNTDWTQLSFIHALYEFSHATPLTVQQNKVFEELKPYKLLYLLALAAKNSKDGTRLNKILKVGDLPNLPKMVTDSKELQGLIDLLNKKIGHFNPQSLVNQDIRVKIEDILTPGRGEDDKQVKKLFLQAIFEIKELLSDESRFDVSHNEYHQIKNELLKNIMIIANLRDKTEYFNKQMTQCNELCQHFVQVYNLFVLNKEIDKDLVKTTLNKMCQFALLHFDTLKKKADTISSDMINELSGQSYMMGKQPDHQVLVPTQTMIKEGLDPVAMLKEMANFAREKKGFDLISFNCSNATMQILAAGAGKKGWCFTQGELGTIFTPHVVYMRAREYVNELNNPLYEHPTPYFFAYKEQLDYYGGRAVSIAAKKDKIMKEESMFGIIKSGADMIFSGGIAMGLELAGSWVFGKQQQLHEEAMEGIKKLENYENMTPKEILRAKRLFDHHKKEVKTPKRQRDDNDTTALEQEAGRAVKRSKNTLL